MKSTFVSGVVEGFYGRPWSPGQRLELFQRLEYMGFNTYLYAPKDDMKHRQLWRDLYSKEETIQLKYLIDSSKKHNITFVYAISPGLDITFSNVTDTFLLKQKMQQVLELGCEAFSLLFDDISPNLRDIDKSFFQSTASAQASLTNDIYDYLKQPSFFLFCPTEYCASRAVPCVLKSEYLSTIGTTLKPNIDIMWTGPKVISKFITLDSIIELRGVLNRQPIIWDNIHANDYDQKRLFLGPYCGRSSKLIPHLRGILTNPNCEFEANFIALHTLGQWVKSNGDSDNQDIGYIPSVALRLAITDWLEVIYQNKDSVNDSKNSISFNTNKDFISVTALGSLSLNPDTAAFTAPEMLISEKICPVLNAPCKSQIIQDNVNTASTLLTLTDPKEAEGNDALKPIQFGYSSDPISPLLVLLPLVDVADVKDGDVTNNNVSLPSNYNCKKCYKNYSNNYEINGRGERFAKSSDKNKELLSHQNDMETIENNLNNLIPMETEDNSSDTENIVDTMAMQVDCADDGHCEIMDVIDEVNDRKIYPETNKESVSSRAEESEMEDTISNESIDLTDATVCNIVPKLTIDDVNLLVHLFFLPYEHGPLAIKMLKLIYWIRSNAYLAVDKVALKNKDNGINNATIDSVDHGNIVKSLEWHMKAKEFEDQVELVRNLSDRMCNIPNRRVLFDLYPYIQELRHVIGSLSSYVKWMGSTVGYKESFMSDDHEPSMFRGGITSELQRMFPLEGSNDLFPSRISFLQYPPRYGQSLFDTDIDATDYSEQKVTSTDAHISNNIGIECLPIQPAIFVMRPYYSSDKSHLYDLCFEIFFNQLVKNTGMDPSQLDDLKTPTFKDLVGDRFIGHFIEFSPESCMLLENEHGYLLGYVLVSSKVEKILQFRQDVYSDKMRLKYGSEITLLNQNDLPQSQPQSAVKAIVDGFFDETFYKHFQEMKDKPHALIHLGIKDCYKETDTLSRRLLARMCSTLKTNSDQIPSVIGDAQLCQDLSPNQTELIDGNNSPQKSVSLPNLIVCCEVDALNTCYEEFYKRCGFIKCNNTDDTLSSISIMSIYV